MITRETADARTDVRQVWKSFTAVEDWPTWTKSITTVRWLDDGPMRVGKRARVKQPSVPTMVWQVTDVQDNAEFTWANHSLGCTTIARHKVWPNDDGTVRITLEIERTGPTAWLVDAVSARLTKRYLVMEAAGHKAASEAAAAQG
jgi:uncharacterized membrane protein